MKNGDVHGSMMLTGSTTELSVWGSSSCSLRVLAVGAGGSGDNGGTGGGSGYIQYQTVSVPPGETVITAKVGARTTSSGETSPVILTDRNITAEGGQWGGDGGNGYSGGGSSSNGGYSGGFNGRNGAGPDPGIGTGENIRTYNFNTWTLSAGGGGSYWATYGGGGGGVLVAGNGPPKNSNQGYGYGGGGPGPVGTSAHIIANRYGLPGVILLEVIDPTATTTAATTTAAITASTNSLSGTPGTCHPANNNQTCCTSSSPCGLREGDCDNDDECDGDLVCGDNNCAAGDSNMDCCTSKCNINILLNLISSYENSI